MVNGQNAADGQKERKDRNQDGWTGSKGYLVHIFISGTLLGRAFVANRQAVMAKR